MQQDDDALTTSSVPKASPCLSPSDSDQGELPRSEWELHERMPRFDDAREFEVWMRDGTVRKVRRVGNRSRYYTPGILLFTDCAHPSQNVWCDEENIAGWRYSGRSAPPLPQHPQEGLNLGALLLGIPYDAAAHAAAYPGY